MNAWLRRVREQPGYVAITAEVGAESQPTDYADTPPPSPPITRIHLRAAVMIVGEGVRVIGRWGGGVSA